MDNHSSNLSVVRTQDAPKQPSVTGGVRPPTTTAQMDESIAILRSSKGRWAGTPVRERIRLLDAVSTRYAPLCDSWVEVGLRAKGAEKDVYATGWEWGSGPMPILRYLRALKRTLVAIERDGAPRLPGKLAALPNGQVAVKVYPSDLYERLTTTGTTVEVRMQPGISADQVRESQAAPYRLPDPPCKLCLVLGAGNVSGIPVNDSLSKLFVDNCVVLLKMNPVNDYLGPLIELALAPLISEGYLQVVYGGVSEGAYLCGHPDIDCVHITGSDKSYEAIAFGTGPAGRSSKAEHHPSLAKPITAELGNIAPAIIVPGPWSEEDLMYQAEQLAANLCDSGSYSCSRTRVILQHTDWDLRHELIRKLVTSLSRVPPRTAYYPGAVEQHTRFTSTYSHAQRCGPAPEGTLPWTIVAGVDAKHGEQMCFTTESFCPVMAETALEASSTADFVTRAVEFANTSLWGTLAASIFVHPDSLRDPDVAEAIEWAVDKLRYGVVAINCIPGLVWGMAVPPWGSFPGNVPWDIQSGSGFVNNSYMFAYPQKTVLRGPFRTWPRPPWFPSRGERMPEICSRISDYEAKPSIGRLLRILVSAIG